MIEGARVLESLVGGSTGHILVLHCRVLGLFHVVSPLNCLLPRFPGRISSSGQSQWTLTSFLGAEVLGINFARAALF